MAKRRDSVIPAEIPAVTKPIYETAAVNQPVKLYEGELELKQGGETLPGRGSVQLEWLPRPRLRFSLDLRPPIRKHPALESGRLHLLGNNWDARVSVLGCSASFGAGATKLTGEVDDFEVGQSQHVAAILFHIVNFKDYIGLAVCDELRQRAWKGRSVIEAGEWRITVDKTEEAEPLFKELKNIGGFAITHVGKLERRDGKEFAAKKSENLFEALFRYLSFCRGAWVAPVLPVGFDESGNRVWEKWRGWKIERWRSVDNWFNILSEEGLSNGFPGFYQRWQDARWNEALLLSNHWYVEANMCAGGVEGSIILAQSAFELLGWTCLVEEKSALSERGYENLPAMDKLRLLLSICGIPAAIPASLSKLAAGAKQNQWKDGPQALTEVRNALVHSKPAKRKRVFDEHQAIVHEASDLSLWYLELVILNKSAYLGRYSNRVAGARWRGEEVEPVPWA
jgi:hypothetical protein